MGAEIRNLAETDPESLTARVRKAQGEIESKFWSLGIETDQFFEQDADVFVDIHRTPDEPNRLVVECSRIIPRMAPEKIVLAVVLYFVGHEAIASRPKVGILYDAFRDRWFPLQEVGAGDPSAGIAAIQAFTDRFPEFDLTITSSVPFGLDEIRAMEIIRAMLEHFFTHRQT